MAVGLADNRGDSANSPYRTGRSTMPRRADIGVLAVIALGGALGSLARWGVGEALPHRGGDIAWSTFLDNVLGAFVLGALMVLLLEVWPPSRLVRPFLGVGVLGGFTTFSTYMLDTQDLLRAGRPGAALVYLCGTLLLGLLASWAGVAVTRAVVEARHQRDLRTRHTEQQHPHPARVEGEAP
jgi:fluoride exporter